MTDTLTPSSSMNVLTTLCQLVVHQHPPSLRPPSLHHQGLAVLAACATQLQDPLRLTAYPTVIRRFQALKQLLDAERIDGSEGELLAWVEHAASTLGPLRQRFEHEQRHRQRCRRVGQLLASLMVTTCSGSIIWQAVVTCLGGLQPWAPTWCHQLLGKPAGWVVWWATLGLLLGALWTCLRLWRHYHRHVTARAWSLLTAPSPRQTTTWAEVVHWFSTLSPSSPMLPPHPWQGAWAQLASTSRQRRSTLTARRITLQDSATLAPLRASAAWMDAATPCPTSPEHHSPPTTSTAPGHPPRGKLEQHLAQPVTPSPVGTIVTLPLERWLMP